MTTTFLIYISNRSNPDDKNLTREIAIDSMQNNHTLGISGILMAVGEYFIQVLEGNDDVLDPLLEKISMDERHSDVRVIHRSQLPDRIFGRWSMGCVTSEAGRIGDDNDLSGLRNEVAALCDDMNEENSRRLRELIVQIPTMLAADQLAVA